MRFFLALLVATGAFAQQPYLVKDIATTGIGLGSSRPSHFLVKDGNVYFATDAADVSGVWRTNGTAAGTTRLRSGVVVGLTTFGSRLAWTDGKQIFVSDDTTVQTLYTSAGPIESDLVEANGKLFFSLNNDLVATDGTTSGTVTIQGNSAFPIARLGNRLVFSSKSGLAITDGTIGGTTTLAPSGVSDASGTTVLAGNRLFFIGTSRPSSPGGQLWVTDGTPEGTRSMPQINANYETFYDRTVSLAVLGDRVLFCANDDQNVSTLWTWDGIATRPVAVRRIDAGHDIAVLDGVAYFGASVDSVTGLWRSDGTADGTKLVLALDGANRYIVNLSAAAGKLWISLGSGLWASDGTAAGTRHLTAAMPGLMPSVSSNGRVFFNADDDVHGLEPWSSDGTPEGTAMIADLAPDVAASSYATPRIGSADRMIFDASTTNAGARTHWVTDGTPEGTRPTFTDDMTSPVRFRDLVYFGNGQELWATDGTPESTRRIATLDGAVRSVTAIGDFFYVSTASSLWVSDGTADGTKQIVSEDVRPIPFAGRAIVAMGGTFSEINGHDPPRPIVSVPSGTSDIAVAGGHFFGFIFANPTTMWADDGSADGMRQIATFSGVSSPSILGAAEDRLIFTIDDGIHGREPWASDGTAAGTHLIADIRPGPLASQIGQSAVLDRRIVFTADDGTNGRALWITDGSAAGTTRISALNATIADDLSTDLAGVKGVGFFVADDGMHGRELWQSDGTPEGTKLVADINPGPSSSFANTFKATDNTLFFNANTSDTGSELWALPLPWRTIAILDARVRSDAATATMAIAIDRAATETVSATWTTSAGDSGVVTFAPGEIRKSIVFPIASDPTAQRNRTIAVRLSDVRGATPTRGYATLIVEGVASAANLSVSVDNSAAFFGIKVTNAGPSAVNATLHILSSGTPASVTGPLPTIQPRASDTTPVYRPGTYGATVTSSTPDPDLSDNTVTLQLATIGNLRMALWPAALTVGSQAAIGFAGSPGTTLPVTSSNPAVLALPDAVTLPATINVTAFAAGTTTITLAKSISLVVTVGPAGTRYRWPANLKFDIAPTDRIFGTPQHLIAQIPAIAYDSGAHPTGVVTFRDGNDVIGTAAVDRTGIAEKLLDILPGTHRLTASYSGDDSFLPDAVTAPPLTIFAPYAPSFIGMVRPLTDTTAEITITIVAPHTAIPTGTITMRRFDQVLAKDVPVIDGKAVAITSKQLFITVDYSGDALYPPTIQSINLVPARHRAAP